MALRTWHTLTLDTAEETYPARVTLVENSDNGFQIDLRERGAELDLSEVRDIFLITQPPKRGEAAVISTGTITGTSQVSVELGRSEVAYAGEADAQLKLMDADGNTISTLRFEYNVQEDVDDGAVPSEQEKTFFQKAIVDIYDSRDEAHAAAEEAINARDRLTGDVGKAIQTLNDDKAEALAEVDTALTNLETDKTSTLDTLETEKRAAIEQMQTETRNNIQALHTDKDAAIAQMNERTGEAIQTLETEKTEAIEQMAEVREANRTNYLPAVETVAERDSTYPSPTHGDTVRVTSEARTYKYSNGSWIVSDENHPTAIAEVARQLDDGGSAEEPLIHGMNIVDSEFNGPADVEIRGTTLVSLGNSNLEKGKYYALTDEKYKVITDGKTVSGVGKFQKGETHKTTADFKGKVQYSTTENPHILKRFGGMGGLSTPHTILTPYTDSFIETAQATIETLNGSSYRNARSEDFNFAQTLFSFDIVEQVERQLGLIPGTSRADKTSWLRSNISKFTFEFHGYGISPQGNKATIAAWDKTSSKWINQTSHEQPTVFKRSLVYTGAGDWEKLVDDGGYAHFIAYSDPVDPPGAGESAVYTDYVSLGIELNSTAQLNTRPTIVRVENFEGKVAGSTVENPHKWYSRGYADILTPVSTGWIERSAGNIAVKDGVIESYSTNVTGTIMQVMFSFDVVTAFERNIGEIPRKTVTEKVAWLKSNLNRLDGTWSGYSSDSSASFSVWTSSKWTRWYEHKTKDISGLSIGGKSVAMQIQDDGFIYFLVYSNPVTEGSSAMIYTDYISLTLEVSPTADFRQPRIPLYEVSKEEYDRIGVTYTDEETKRRYPIVQGVQHLVNPYVVNPGENLLPPFTDERWNKTHDGATVTVVSPYEVNSYSPQTTQGLSIRVPVIPGASYYFDAETSGGDARIGIWDSANNRIWNYRRLNAGVVTIPNNANEVSVRLTNYNDSGVTINYKNPILTLGTEPKPFTPYNPSTLHAPVTLSAVGDKRDVLYQQDGRWYVRRATKTIEITGESDGWKTSGIFEGIHRFSHPNFIPAGEVPSTNAVKQATKYTGKALDVSNYRSSYEKVDGLVLYEAGLLEISVNRDEYGNRSDVQSTDNIKRYFNGWKYTDGTTWTSVTGNGQTATLEEALTTMPDDYTPYKLTYVLAETEVIDVTDLVDGDLIINENALLEVGSGFTYTEDDEGNRTYTLTPAGDRATVTANVQNAVVRFQRTLRSAFDALNDKVQDRSEDAILLKRQMLNALVRLDALEGRVDLLENPPEPTPQ